MWFQKDLNEKGAVLILVLWVVAFLSMLGGYFTLETTLRRNLGMNQWNMLRARLAIWSALNVISPCIKDLKDSSGDKSDKQPGEVNERIIIPDGTTYKIQIGGQELTFSVEDERGKIDLNRAEEKAIRDVLTALLGQDKGQSLTDAILDWKDRDNEKRIHGAESQYYASLPVPYKIANGKFALLEQLLLVKGITPLLYWGPIEWNETGSQKGATWEGGLQDIFTIYNGSDKVLEEAAPKPLIDILNKEYFKEQEGSGTLRFKACAFDACYQVFFKKGAGDNSGVQIIHWQQVPRID